MVVIFKWQYCANVQFVIYHNLQILINWLNFHLILNTSANQIYVNSPSNNVDHWFWSGTHCFSWSETQGLIKWQIVTKSLWHCNFPHWSLPLSFDLSFFSSWKFFSLCFFSGEVINPKDRCKKCQGKKVCKESKILEVTWTVHYFVVTRIWIHLLVTETGILFDIVSGCLLRHFYVLNISKCFYFSHQRDYGIFYSLL